MQIGNRHVPVLTQLKDIGSFGCCVILTSFLCLLVMPDMDVDAENGSGDLDPGPVWIIHPPFSLSTDSLGSYIHQNNKSGERFACMRELRLQFVSVSLLRRSTHPP